MDLYTYREELRRKNFIYSRFLEFKSYVESELQEIKYYADYVIKINSLDGMLKNDKEIQERKGFWCKPYSLNGEVDTSYYYLNSISSELVMMNICVHPSKPLGGGIYFKIVDAEKFYNYMCYLIVEIISKILPQISLSVKNVTLDKVIEIFKRIDDDFVTLEKWLFNNKPNDFEKGLTYLFILYGYNAIHVGDEFEQNSLPTRRIKYGKSSVSIDIIAYYSNKIFVCQCSTDFGYKKIIDVLDICKELNSSAESMEIIPLIATTVSESMVQETLEEARNKGTKVLTKESIQQMLDDIKKGNKHPLKIFEYLL